MEKIGELVGEGVKTVDEMKRHLRQFVKTELFPGQTPPASTNRHYYPTDVDVRNHMNPRGCEDMVGRAHGQRASTGILPKPPKMLVHCET